MGAPPFKICDVVEQASEIKPCAARCTMRITENCFNRDYSKARVFDVCCKEKLLDKPLKNTPERKENEVAVKACEKAKSKDKFDHEQEMVNRGYRLRSTVLPRSAWHS